MQPKSPRIKVILAQRDIRQTSEPADPIAGAFDKEAARSCWKPSFSKSFLVVALRGDSHFTPPPEFPHEENGILDPLELLSAAAYVVVDWKRGLVCSEIEPFINANQLELPYFSTNTQSTSYFQRYRYLPFRV
ncbi:hypothetical protein DXX99_09740 [Ammonifex thiophilus]|uniref:Uncharacterized protein n=1 Tax=Ammonifex thiophilus TaxID=444093 RepID=A0A3D8P375_9THEO|nr:hypothetical protein DXX99_09740 [Ammonifex thiophilus]